VAVDVAVLGIGYWGPNLIRNFVHHPDVDKVYCFDEDQRRVASACDKFPVIQASSYEEILANESICAIAIATPVATHYPLARQALEHGKHVFIEKPMTAKADEARHLLEIAHERDLRIMVDHIFVYNGAVRKIKDMIGSGEIGDLMYFDAVRINLGLWDLAPHDLSIMYYICEKKPIMVSAIGKSHFGAHEDIAYLTMTFEDECIAHLHTNWLAPVKVRQILIGGSQKMIVYDEMETTEKIKVYDKGIEVTTREGIYKTLIQYRTGDVYVPAFETLEPLACAVTEFIDAITEKRAPITDGEAGLRVVETLEAAQESMKNNGHMVRLDGR
jgi:predicted dehydrogenase